MADKMDKKMDTEKRNKLMKKVLVGAVLVGAAALVGYLVW